MAIAWDFQTGRGQTILLPKKFYVEADTVLLNRTDDGFLVIARDPWGVFLEGIEQSSDESLGGRCVPPKRESGD